MLRKDQYPQPYPQSLRNGCENKTLQLGFAINIFIKTQSEPNKSDYSKDLDWVKYLVKLGEQHWKSSGSF
jgi:hypothetical protein